MPTDPGRSSPAAPARAASRTFAQRARYAVRFATAPTRRNRLHWLSWAVTLGIELALVALLWDGPVFGWEQSLTRQLQGHPFEDVIFDVTSTATNTLAMSFLVPFLAFAAVLALFRKRTLALLVLLTFPAHVLGQFPKALVDRVRPSDAFPGIVGTGETQSFPSGHSEFVLTFYGFLLYVALFGVSSKRVKALAIAGYLIFVLAVGYGRIALGRHWPLDVAASYVVGLGLLSGMVWLYAALRAAFYESARDPDKISVEAIAPPEGRV